MTCACALAALAGAAGTVVVAYWLRQRRMTSVILSPPRSERAAVPPSGPAVRESRRPAPRRDTLPVQPPPLPPRRATPVDPAEGTADLTAWGRAAPDPIPEPRLGYLDGEGER